jgi:hypothetical protein
MGPRCSSAETQVCHRSYIIAASNYGRRSFSKYGISYYDADVNIYASIVKYGIDIQIVRPEMTKFKMFR